MRVRMACILSILAGAYSTAAAAQQTVRYEPEMVDPNYVVVAGIDKKYLPRR
jgi:hypothetical protein